MSADLLAIVAHGADDLRVEPLPTLPLGEDDVRLSPTLGGICGSDLHYFHRGGVGDFLIREPLTLGHELVARVAEVGSGVVGLAPGDRVVINPSAPCGRCPACRRGEGNLCPTDRFLGSAAHRPHVQGGFRQQLSLAPDRCLPLPAGLADEHAVFTEPLAVALHAVGRAGPLLGRRVLVVGAGPIGGLLTLLCARAGAGALVVSDLLEPPLTVARKLGASETVIPGPGGLGLREPVDIAFEASGAPAGLGAAVSSLRRGGRLVLVGMLPPGETPVPANRLVTGEMELAGSFRFRAEEFESALGMLAAGLDVSPLISAQMPLAEARAAFELASDRSRAVKVQISFPA